MGYIERVLKDHNGIVPAARPLVFVSIKVKGIKGTTFTFFWKILCTKKNHLCRLYLLNEL